MGRRSDARIAKGVSACQSRLSRLMGLPLWANSRNVTMCNRNRGMPRFVSRDEASLVENPSVTSARLDKTNKIYTNIIININIYG